jgi:hypothetical protein
LTLEAEFLKQKHLHRPRILGLISALASSPAKAAGKYTSFLTSNCAGQIDDRNMADDDFKKYLTLHQIPMTTSQLYK